MGEALTIPLADFTEAGNPHMRTDSLTIDTDEAARRLGISRERLDAMVVECTTKLPGRPINIASTGTNKRRLLWNIETLMVWFQAWGEWRDRRDSRPQKAEPKARKRRRSAANGPGKTGPLTFAEISETGKL